MSEHNEHNDPGSRADSDSPSSDSPSSDSPSSGPTPADSSPSDSPPAGFWRARWRAFTRTPFFPASVLVLIVAAGAGLFAASYTYALADPTPRDIPAAVVGHAQDERRARAFVTGMEKALGSSLKLHRYGTYAEAKEAVDDQKVFAVLRVGADDEVVMELSGAAGASVAEVLSSAAPEAGREAGVKVTVRDLKPLGRGDPRGLTIFYITLAADIIGFIGAIQLHANVPNLTRWPRVAVIAAYSLLGGFVIAAMVDWLLRAVNLPFVHSWTILSLTMFTAGMVFTMFNTLFGRWAMIPTWFLLVLLGNPSSGGAVSWPLLPSLLGTVGRWLPPGASVNAQHTAVYFPGNVHAWPYLVLAAWALAGATVFLTLDERLRGQPAGEARSGGDGQPGPSPADTPPAGDEPTGSGERDGRRGGPA
ncbi:ABC transporter permease [Streptomyces ovatisporus]|uniref:ABC transporter permease n=1 Tax=Streptomyces ovatisporus TaxID=1128682 RepID=A0ABV9ABD2_9ACTN